MTDRITQALNGLLSPDELDGEEQEVYLDRFAEKMRTASPEEEAFWAKRRRLGLGCGDEDDSLVYAATDAEIQRLAEDSLVPTASEQAFWAERERLGLGVGMDDDGNLTYPAVLMPPATKTLQ